MNYIQNNKDEDESVRLSLKEKRATEVVQEVGSNIPPLPSGVNSLSSNDTPEKRVERSSGAQRRKKAFLDAVYKDLPVFTRAEIKKTWTFQKILKKLQALEKTLSNGFLLLMKVQGTHYILRLQLHLRQINHRNL
nr:unnamed protein product [Callosobruchus chinensis]